MEVQRRGDLEWFKALEKRWVNRPRPPPPPNQESKPANSSDPQVQQQQQQQQQQQHQQQQHKERLIAFYQTHNPDKIDSIDATLEKYSGKEEELFEKLEQRYCTAGQFPSPPPPLLQESLTKAPLCFMVFATHVDIPVKIQLFSDICPMAAEIFRQLCQMQYYKSKIHRIVPNLCVQGGDYTTGDGTGGRSIYQKGQPPGVVDMWGKFKDETFSAHNEAGLLSMPNSGPNTNGSQFFFTLAPAPHLNGKHVVFGRVVEGLEVILSFGRQPTNAATQRPIQDIEIIDCGEIVDNVNGQIWIRASEQSSNDHAAAAAKKSPLPPPPTTTLALSSSTTFSSSSFATKYTQSSSPFTSSGTLAMSGQSPRVDATTTKTEEEPSGATLFRLAMSVPSSPTTSSSSKLGAETDPSWTFPSGSSVLVGGNDNAPLPLSQSFGSLTLDQTGDKEEESRPPPLFGEMSSAAVVGEEGRDAAPPSEEESSGANAAVSASPENNACNQQQSVAVMSAFGGHCAAGGLTFGSLAQTKPTMFGSAAKGATQESSLLCGNGSAGPSAFSAFSGASLSNKPSIFGNAATKPSTFCGSLTGPAGFGSSLPSPAFTNPSTTAPVFPSAPLLITSSSNCGSPPSASLFGKPFNQVQCDNTLSFRASDEDSESTENERDDSYESSDDDDDTDDDGDDDDDDGSKYVESSDQEISNEDVFDDSHLNSGDEAVVKLKGNAFESMTILSQSCDKPGHDVSSSGARSISNNVIVSGSGVFDPPDESSKEAIPARRLSPLPLIGGTVLVPEEVICGEDVFLDALGDDRHFAPLEHGDTMRRDNASAPCAQLPSEIVSSGTDNDRPPERIEFDAAERSSNVSFASQDAYTPNSSRLDDYDRLARQSVGEETMESELVNSNFTVDSSVSEQVELLRRDIEVSSLDIKEALRRVERQQERVRSHQASSLTNTPTRYSRSLLPPPPTSQAKPSGTASNRNNLDFDPAGRFVYLSRIADKLSKAGPMSRRSFPDEVVLASVPPSQESPRYRSPVLVEDKDLEELQKESRSVQPLVATFDRWTKDHVERQKEHSSPGRLEPKDKGSR